MTRLFASAILISVTAVACSDGTSASLTGPSTLAAANNVIAVTVSAEPGPAPAFLFAKAQMSDGRTQDVTSTAQWESMNPAVASVSSGGRINAHQSGTVTFRATYRDVSGSVQADVAPAAEIKRYAVAGVVSASTKPYRVVPEALIEVISGPSAGQSIVAGRDGSFSLTQLIAGETRLRVSSPGYHAWSSKTFHLGSDTTADVQLTPIGAE